VAADEDDNKWDYKWDDDHKEEKVRWWAGGRKGVTEACWVKDRSTAR
jgi:hypothetical protein